MTTPAVHAPSAPITRTALDATATVLIESMHQAGASVHTIASALNRAGSCAPSGLRWTAKSVRRGVSGPPRCISAAATSAPPATSRHDAHAYADQADLVQHVAVYLADALYRGAACVVISSSLNRSSIRRALARLGLAGLLTAPHFVEVDAQLLLDEFMRDGRPDPALFEDLVLPLLSVESGSTTLNAYDDMVDVLWQAGNVTGALALEDLWNGLQAELAFELMCGYSAADLCGAEADDIRLLRSAHGQLSGLRGLDS